MLQHVPNLITLARILAVPLMVWLILKERMDVAFWLFIAAGVSDAVDGFIAKRFNAETVVGAFLDPLADKALLICCFVSLGFEGHLPMWLVILVVFRDILIIGGALLFQMVTGELKMQPIMVSKVNTVFQIVLVGVLLATLGLDLGLARVVDILVYLTAVTTVASGAAYVWTWGRRALIMEGEE